MIARTIFLIIDKGNKVKKYYSYVIIMTMFSITMQPKKIVTVTIQLQSPQVQV